MAERATIRTSSGQRVTGEVARRERHSPSGAELLALIACPPSGATWKDSRTTVRDKHDRFFTGRKVR